MKQFYSQVISTKSQDDIERWRGLVNRLPQIDIYYSPEYMTVFEATKGAVRSDFGGEGQLFFLGNETNFIIYPFFKRRISELPFSELLPPDSKEWLDIASPYGFCGPIAYIGEPEVEKKLWIDFWEEFHRYCFQNNIVTEFARLHPYFKNHLPLSQLPQVNIRKMSEVVYVDLEQDVSLIRKNATKGNKSSVSKARRSGVEVFCSNTKEDLDAFHRLYIDTMARNKAKESYFFSREFVDHLFQLLGRDVQLFSARYRDQVIATSLFLFKDCFTHYYLGGSDADSFSLRPNNLLFHEVILQSKQQGYKIFDLGGGNRPNDSLFQFKTSFSKTTADFYTYSRVHNEEIYKLLCQARDEYDKLSGQKIVKSDYFPEYRR